MTGNSIEELSSRFLRWLVHQLAYLEELDLLDRFHFFSNSGGVYIRFPDDDFGIQALKHQVARAPSDNSLADAVLSEITSPDPSTGRISINPRFIDSAYLQRCSIPDDDVNEICSILRAESDAYSRYVQGSSSTLSKQYDLSIISDGDHVAIPRVEPRFIEYGHGVPSRATVQITLKPIISFHQAFKQTQMFGKDVRTRVVASIQSRLDSRGLSHYVARPGGRASIDITLAKLDKAYALEFLIDRLNVQGNARLGQALGSNTLFFGDEVIAGGGNDYAVTRIPGLLAFAVNPQRDLIPLLSHVFVPSAILEGPEATAHVLQQFNSCALRVLVEHSHKRSGVSSGVMRTAVEIFKEELFKERIKVKLSAIQDVSHLTADDWQTLHTFVTLMIREDPGAKQWLSIVVGELNAIMSQLAINGGPIRPGLGGSSAKQRE